MKVEGTLFLFEREAEPKYGFTIMNRSAKTFDLEIIGLDVDTGALIRLDLI